MRRALIITACAVLALGACGDDDDDDTVAPTTVGTVAVGTLPAAPTTSASTTANNITVPRPTGSTTVPVPSETASAQVTVVATDYRYDGLPTFAVTGTLFKLQNDSEKEVHEMVIVRIPDEVTETVGQILALPEAEQEALVGNEEPVAVIVALPGEEGVPVVGDGTINAAGRYAVLCFIPVGADPDVVREAMEAPPGTGPEEQPDLGDGPPHIMEGMYAELVVE